MSGRKTPDDYKRCAKEGMTYQQAADYLSISISSVYTMASKHGLTFKREGKDPPLLEEYRKCADAGMSMAETARHMGVDFSSVRHAAERHGVKFASGRKYADTSGIIKAATDGLTIKEAAERLGLSYSTVSNVASRLGIKFMRQSEGGSFDLPKHLTPQQAEDVRTYMTMGRKTKDEAIRLATAPRKRVTCLPPDMRRLTQGSPHA